MTQNSERKLTMDTITLEMPQKSDLDYWRELTNWNNHTLARIGIAEWLVKQFHAQGAIVPHKNGYDAFSKALDLLRVFNAIETIHCELTYLPSELAQLRNRKTGELFDLMRGISLEISDAIHKTL